MNNPRLFLPLQSRVENFFCFFLGGPAHSLQATSLGGPAHSLQATSCQANYFIFLFDKGPGII